MKTMQSDWKYGEWVECRKSARNVMRELTNNDFSDMKGFVQTLEGPKAFVSGDYLAKDSKGCWPILAEDVRKTYLQVSEKDEEGFAEYQILETREAMRMSENFVAGGLSGQAHGFKVRSNGSEWPVDEELFYQTYEKA